MGVYEFDYDSFNDAQDVEKGYVGKPKEIIGKYRETPIVNNVADPGNRQNDTRNCQQCKPCDNGNKSGIDPIDINFVEEVREVYVPGFKLMDKGIKNYFSGIRIPVGEGLEEYRILPVRVTGADPEALIYSDKNLLGGRLKLPILAISRKNESFDSKRYTPPIKNIYRHMLCNGKKSESVYRSVPYLIDYTLEIWSEHKSDAEYALYAIISKLNPIGSFFIEEPNMGLSHEVIIHPKGSSDESDLESDNENRPQIKKSINITMEGWLPTPTKVTSNILAKPLAIKEGILDSNNKIKTPGETYHVIRDSF